jgi:signal transduction histidine kinase
MSLIGNLVRNAIKYMGDQPVRLVDLSVRDLYSCVRIEVQDTGPGLADGLGERAFDPYVRGTPRSEHTGLGLGLATVKRLVEAHGGKVRVRSEPGTGCLFWFELPKGAPPQAA